MGGRAVAQRNEAARNDWTPDHEAITGAYYTALWLLEDRQRAQMTVNRTAYMLPISSMKARDSRARTNFNRLNQTNEPRFNYRAHFDNPNHLFTRVFMNQLEAEEIEQEKVAPLDEKGRVRRCAKQLFTLSVNQNSFWAVIALARVLCNYTAP